MRSPHEITEVIEVRLRKYVSRDTTGVRRALLQIFLRLKCLTIAEIFAIIARKFSISYHSVAAMVGLIASKIGILHVTKNREGSCSVYSLKEQYAEMVARIVS
jgi:hypothetical protein